MPILSDAATELSSPQVQQVQKAGPAAAAPGFDEQYARARALANAGQPALAVDAYTLLLARSPGNADVLLGRGLAWSRQQRWAQAEADLKAATVAAPGYADAWLALGDVYRWSDRPALAIDAYDRALALRPGDAAAGSARASAEAALLRPAAQVAPAAGSRAIAAQAVLAPGYTWAAALAASWTRRSSQGDTWNEQNASVRRYFGRGSLGFESLRAERLGRSDHAWALDAYTGLWTGAYANLRYQHAPRERLYPGSSWRAELFQGLGGGWELSLSKDRLGFDGGAVDIDGFSLARYIGNFYLSLRRTSISSPGSDTSGQRLVARYYYKGDADSYAELSQSRGRGDDALSLALGPSRSGATGLAIVSYFNEHWHARLGASHAREDKGVKERSIAIALGRRW